MRKSILVDTGPLYALTVASDQHHTRAYTEARLLRESEITVSTTFTTLLETHSLLLKRLHLEQVQLWLKINYQQLDILNILNEDYETAVATVAKFADQRISLFDAVLITLSRKFNIPIWTFDRDFDVMGAQVWR